MAGFDFCTWGSFSSLHRTVKLRVLAGEIRLIVLASETIAKVFLNRPFLKTYFNICIHPVYVGCSVCVCIVLLCLLISLGVGGEGCRFCKPFPNWAVRKWPTDLPPAPTSMAPEVNPSPGSSVELSPFALPVCGTQILVLRGECQEGMACLDLKRLCLSSQL